MAGGIVGMNVGNIYNVSASGSITGGDYVAGLVGQNFRWIRMRPHRCRSNNRAVCMPS